ncbi:MAG: pyridoxal phosphate-dependent aminotransferase [Vicinamibacterales bacterium]
MRFARLPADVTPNATSRALGDLRAAGIDVIDLTESNPTRAGIPYPDGLLAPLADPRALAYDPEPWGLRPAREAVSADFARRGLDVPPDRVALTASTSEAYALLFKLLCEAGDRVLVPRPSYPLFEHLTALESIVAVPYDLDPHGGWRLDASAVRAAADDRTRAVLVVSPNNPTGSCLHLPELEALVEVAGARGLAIIGDEVFADYLLEPEPGMVSVLAQDEVLAFGLGGLSKSAGLPQLKLGWIGMAGPEPVLTETSRAYEIVADTYLSVSSPVQLAAGQLIAGGAAPRAAIRERTAQNLAALDRALAPEPAITRLRVEGGWSAVLRVPAVEPEESLVLDLLMHEHLLVHPGYFFDFPGEAWIVVSLLPRPEVFEPAVARLARRAGGRGRPR